MSGEVKLINPVTDVIDATLTITVSVSDGFLFSHNDVRITVLISSKPALILSIFSLLICFQHFYDLQNVLPQKDRKKKIKLRLFFFGYDKLKC